MAKQNRPPRRRTRNSVVRKTTVSIPVSRRLEFPPPGHPDWKKITDWYAALHTPEYEAHCREMFIEAFEDFPW